MFESVETTLHRNWDVFKDLLRVMRVVTDDRRTDNAVHNECIRLEDRPIEA
jgi:hypothetical protein